MLLAHLALEVCLQTYNPIWKRMLALFSQWGQTNLRGLQAHHRLDQHFRIRLVLEPKRTLQCLPDISSAFTNFRRPLHDDFHDTQPAIFTALPTTWSPKHQAAPYLPYRRLERVRNWRPHVLRAVRRRFPGTGICSRERQRLVVELG